MDQIVEVRRPVTLYANVLGRDDPQRFHLAPGESLPNGGFAPAIGRVPDVIWQALLKKKDSDGHCPLEGLIKDGTIRHLNANEANSLVEGKTAPLVSQVVQSPLQAAAEAFAKVRDDKEVSDSDEEKTLLAQQAAIEAAQRIPFKEAPMPVVKKKQEHGKAYDEDEVEPKKGR